MAYENYDATSETMNDRGRSNRRPNRDDWTPTIWLWRRRLRIALWPRRSLCLPGLHALRPLRPLRLATGCGSLSGSYGRGEDRDMWDRAGDEIASWFGDEDAERRRDMDARRDESHRGRGPKGYLRSDSRINEDVHDRLTDHPRLDASDISVSVENGEVTLSGFVRRAATSASRRTVRSPSRA